LNGLERLPATQALCSSQRGLSLALGSGPLKAARLPSSAELAVESSLDLGQASPVELKTSFWAAPALLIAA